MSASAFWQVYIATPAYGGQVTVDYMTSVIHMVTQLKEATQATHGSLLWGQLCQLWGQVAWQLSLVAGQFWPESKLRFSWIRWHMLQVI